MTSPNQNDITHDKNDVEFAAKYGIGEDVIKQTQDDNLWIQYLVQAKHEAEIQKKQVEDY